MNRPRPRGLLTVVFLTLSLVPSLAAANDNSKPKRWTVQEYKTTGTWHIEHRGDKRVIVLSKDFRTAPGPDLKIFLSPLPTSKIRGSNATRGSVKVAKLKRAHGAQSYVLPARVDLSRYRTIAIHCERYAKLFAAASL